MNKLDLLPEARREAAKDALTTAFGAQSIGDLRLLQGGVSGALIYRVEIGDRPYVLRLEPERIALQHRERGFACMAAAALVGVAPAVHHADPIAGIAVMGFVHARPLSEHPGGSAGLAQELGELVARIQATPPFPLVSDSGDVIAAVLASLAASGMFAAGQLDRHVDGLARLRAGRPWDPRRLVSSHNDLNPRNMMFDGRRVWLVDWELASRNDPLFDLAILTTEVAAAPDLEDIVLSAALGRAPDPVLRARLAVTRLLVRLFYGCIVLETFAGRRSAQETNLEALTPAEFAATVAEGRLGSGASETAYAFGKMSLAAFLDGVSAPDFGGMLALAAEGSQL